MRWKVDRVLANQRLNLIEDAQVTSNVPKAWFLVLGCNRQDGKGGGWLETTQRLKQRRDEAGIWIASMLTVSSFQRRFQKTEVVVDVGH